ncbi:MAG: hypothetical protein LBL07_17565 [Tannerella sp.]|nr:hypothetical protein [Tannerella sp.]
MNSIMKKTGFWGLLPILGLYMAFIQPATAQTVPAGKTLPQDDFRQEICLNGLWDFKCDANGEWTQIRVPGCYSVIQDGKWGKNLWDAFLYPKSWTGKGGTYQRRIELPADLRQKAVTFYCGASCFHTYVSLNGQPVGEFHDGFFPFEFPLNGALTKNRGDRILTVRISDEGEWTFSGESNPNRGITEDTYLKIYPEIYTDPHTPVIKTRVEKKQIEVGVSINNTSAKKTKVFVRHFVTDRSGQTVQVFDAGWMEIPAKGSVRNETAFAWENPHLWSVYDPYLYHLHTILYAADGKAFDKNTKRFGFREISIKEHHVYLNGEELFLRGHGGHDLGDLQGTREYATQWFTEMKSRGINFIRMHIYPRHGIFYDVADELGFLIEAEGAYHFRVPEKEERWKMHLGYLVQYQRNCPSVFTYSVSNELRWQGGGEKKPLIDYVRSLDDTRPVFASDFSLESKHGDFVGHHYNAGTVFDEWAEFGVNKPMLWDELGDVWQETRPLSNGTAGYEVSSQDWATGMWRDGHDQISNNISGMVDGKVINGSLHRVNGYVPWDLSYTFLRWQPTNKARNSWLQHDSLSGPGLKLRAVQPCSSPLNIWDETLPVYEPNPGFYIFEKHLRTVRFFDVDDYRTYYGGQEITRTGKLYYEDLRTADAIHCNVETLDGKVLTSNVQPFRISAGEVRDNVNCRFKLPEVAAVTPVKLVRRFYRGNEACSEDVLPVKLFPSPEKLLSGINTNQAAVYKKEEIAGYLRSKGVQVISLQDKKVVKIDAYNLLIAESLSDFPAEEIKTWLQNGGKLLLLNGQDTVVPPSALIPLNGGVHRLIAGMNQTDFSFWRGGSTGKILDLPTEKSNFRTVLAGNKNGDGAALYEQFCGKGIILHSGLNLSEALESEPAATHMLASMLSYLDAYQPVMQRLKCGIIAEENTGKIYLEQIGLLADRLQAAKLPDLSAYHTLLLDGESLNIATLLCSGDNAVRLRQFVGQGGKILFTALNGRTCELYRQLTGKAIRLTEPYLGERTHCVKAAISWILRETPQEPVEYYDKIMVPQPFERNYDALISGMANKDLDWGGRSMFDRGIELAGMDPVMASSDYNILLSNWKTDWTRPDYGGEYINQSKDLRRAYWFINRDPVLFKLNEGKGFYLFNQLNIDGDYATDCRLARQLLTNLGCAVGSDHCLPDVHQSFDRNAEFLQKERFAKVNRLLEPATRQFYGEPESLKPLIVSSFRKNTVKQEVLLLGNEMMQELAPLIKNRMGENYEVSWNTKTLGNSDAILKNIEPWLKEKQEWDMILVIIGEEDVKTPSDGKTTPVEQYSANVEKIMETLGKTKAKLYLCTLPPVPEKAKGYEPALPRSFNSVARSIVDRYDVYTFDLYDFIGRNYPEYLRSDAVAFPVSMKRNIGKQLGEALISFGAQVVN